MTRRDVLELAAAWQHNNRNLSCLRGFLQWLGHPLAGQVPRGRTPAPKRERVWYTLSELEAIVEACATPRERLVVHLACELMLRRCEIARLRREDLLERGIRILGKGRYGGKPRTLPYHPYTRQVVSDFISSSTPRFTLGRERTDPGAPLVPPSAILPFGKSSPSISGPLLGLKRSALDKVLKGIEESLRWEGVNISLEFHALRRTGGRLYVDAGIRAGKKPLQVLNELRGIYGHEDLRMTIHYLGWELEDAAETMALMPRLERRSKDAAHGGEGRPLQRVHPGSGSQSSDVPEV